MLSLHKKPAYANLHGTNRLLELIIRLLFQQFLHSSHGLREVHVAGKGIDFFAFDEELHRFDFGELSQGVDDGTNEHFLSG